MPTPRFVSWLPFIWRVSLTCYRVRIEFLIGKGLWLPEPGFCSPALPSAPPTTCPFRSLTDALTAVWSLFTASPRARLQTQVGHAAWPSPNPPRHRRTFHSHASPPRPLLAARRRWSRQARRERRHFCHFLSSSPLSARNPSTRRNGGSTTASGRIAVLSTRGVPPCRAGRPGSISPDGHWLGRAISSCRSLRDATGADPQPLGLSGTGGTAALIGTNVDEPVASLAAGPGDRPFIGDFTAEPEPACSPWTGPRSAASSSSHHPPPPTADLRGPRTVPGRGRRGARPGRPSFNAIDASGSHPPTIIVVRP